MSLRDSRCILEVEDEENDILLLEFAFERAGVPLPVHVARDGQQAIDYLAGLRDFADRSKYPMPSLVLLDLNIPKVLGLDVLRWIRSQRALNPLIVIVFSSSNLPSDVNAALRLGANAYFVKPIVQADRIEVARTIGIWLGSDEGAKSIEQAQRLNLLWGRSKVGST